MINSPLFFGYILGFICMALYKLYQLSKNKAEEAFVMCGCIGFFLYSAYIPYELVVWT